MKIENRKQAIEEVSQFIRKRTGSVHLCQTKNGFAFMGESYVFIPDNGTAIVVPHVTVYGLKQADLTFDQSQDMARTMLLALERTGNIGGDNQGSFAI